MEIKGLHIGGVSLAQQNSPKPVAKPRDDSQDAVKLRLSRAVPTPTPGLAAIPVAPAGEGGGDVATPPDIN